MSESAAAETPPVPPTKEMAKLNLCSPVEGAKKPNPFHENDPKVLEKLRKDTCRYIDPCEMQWGPFEGSSNTCNSFSATETDVRGPNYIDDGIKIKSKPAAFRFIGLSCFQHPTPICNVANRNPTLKKRLQEPDCPYLFIVNFLVPVGEETISAPMIWARTLPPGVDKGFDKTWNRFVNGDDTIRNNTFKMICQIDHCPWSISLALKAVGGMRPVLTGNKIGQEYHSGPKFFEVDLDIAASKIAKGLSGMIVSQLKKMVVNLSFVLEAGHEEGELPERVLAAARTCKGDIQKCCKLAPWAHEKSKAAADTSTKKS